MKLYLTLGLLAIAILTAIYLFYPRLVSYLPRAPDAKIEETLKGVDAKDAAIRSLSAEIMRQRAIADAAQKARTQALADADAIRDTNASLATQMSRLEDQARQRITIVTRPQALSRLAEFGYR